MELDIKIQLFHLLESVQDQSDTYYLLYRDILTPPIHKKAFPKADDEDDDEFGTFSQH